MKEETIVDDIIKGEYFEETSDSMKYEYKWDLDTSIMSRTKEKIQIT